VLDKFLRRRGFEGTLRDRDARLDLVLALLIGHPFTVGAIVLTLELRFVPHEDSEGVGVSQQVVECAELEVRGVERRIFCSQFFASVGEEYFLVLARAAEAPFGVGHFPDGALLGQIAGSEVVAQFVEHGLVFGRVVAGEQHGLGTESVAETVGCRSRFTFGGAWATGAPRVCLIGFDLCRCSHVGFLL
jgi:hypothetical protein